MGMMKRAVTIGIFVVGMVSVGGSAIAQQLGAGEGVMDRARPEYDAKGLPLGGFRLFPTFNFVYCIRKNYAIMQLFPSSNKLSTYPADGVGPGYRPLMEISPLFDNIAI